MTAGIEPDHGYHQDLRPCVAREPASGHLHPVPAAIIKH